VSLWTIPKFGAGAFSTFPAESVPLCNEVFRSVGPEKENMSVRMGSA